jgi:SPP1 gp7 family putative phage head morphogenesis protein
LLLDTIITYGRGRVVVTGTGMRTELGQIATLLQSVEEEKTPLQRRTAELGKWLGLGALVIVAIVFALGVWVVRARIERWAARLEVLHRQRWRGAVLTATGVDLATMIGPEGARMTIAASVERNTSLIRSVSDETRRRIGEAVFGGFNRRDEPRVVAKAIREAVGMERKRALRIAADQNVKLASQLNIERAQEAGLTHYQWVHSGKLHPRQSHLERNGKRYEYGKPEGDQPGYAIHCGCVSRACLSLDGEF